MRTRRLLERVAAGELSIEDAERELKVAPFTDLGFAKPDTHRELRQGVAEVIYGAGKTPEQIVGIARSMRESGAGTILMTRLSVEAAEIIGADVELDYDPSSRTGIVGAIPEPDGDGTILVVCAGTCDLPVALEARRTAQALGNDTRLIADVGVAGLHRLLAVVPEMMQARAIVAVAGMEGALASVVAGIASCPVIAVPTSVGYGANFGGLSALLTMLNSCAAGVSVVNIDNGFGAAFQASLINHVRSRS